MDWYRYETIKGERHLYAEWPSYRDFRDQALHGETDMKAADRSSRMRNGDAHEEGWYGSDTWEELMTQSQNGTDDGRKCIEEYVGAITRVLGSRIKQPVYRYEEIGEDFDIGAVLEMRPEAWLQPEEVIRHGRSQSTAHLWCDYAASWCVSTEVIETKGAVALALAMLLEQAGVPTRITLAASNRTSIWDQVPEDKHIQSNFVIPFKNYGEIIDLPLSCFAFCNAGMLRRLTFSVWEQFCAEDRESLSIKHMSGYGTPCDVHRHFKPKGCIEIHNSHYNENWETTEKAQNWIEDTLKVCGVEMFSGARR